MKRVGTWLWGARELLQRGRPDVALAFLGGLGDELLCTAALVEWQRRGARNVWLRTRKPEIFSGVAPGAQILRDDARYHRLAERLGRPFRYLAYSQFDPGLDRDHPPTRHIIAEMCARAGLTGRVSIRPHWTVSAAERAAANSWRDCLAIQTSTLVAHVPMQNKQWRAERFQAVVDHFGSRIRFVQIGSTNDPPVRGAVDLRGKTSLRETAAVLHDARGFVGLVGFLMHLARAVECPGVIVYGGRETPELTGYACNQNVARTPPCSPCWQRSRCDHELACMRDISAADVIAATTRMLEQPRGPLQTDVVAL